jgi:hypothetical protein
VLFVIRYIQFVYELCALVGNKFALYKHLSQIITVQL